MKKKDIKLLVEEFDDQFDNIITGICECGDNDNAEIVIARDYDEDGISELSRLCAAGDGNDLWYFGKVFIHYDAITGVITCGWQVKKER
jgi:hypothetical protein